MKLSIIIPVFNEEKTIVQLLEKIVKLSIKNVEKEIIVIDDGSTDNTSRRIQDLIKKNKNIIFERQTINKGKGAAITAGLHLAKGEYIVIQDADLEYDPQDIPKLLEPIFRNKATIVYGTRLKRMPNFLRDERTVRFFIHYLGNKLLSLITSLLYGQWITDMETGYKVIPRNIFNKLQIHAKGFDVEPEITAKLLKNGYTIIEVPISTNPRGYREGKKLNTFDDGWKAIKTLLKYKFINRSKIVNGNHPNILFITTIVIIVLFSIVLRFLNYSERWGLAYDQSHDALIARYAIENSQLPLLGPFSSAGPFQTGGAWYWIIMIGMVFFPWAVITPWIFMTSLYVLFVLVLILLSKELVNKNFALIVGGLAAVSSAQITQGTNLTNQTPQAIFSLFAIWFAVRYLRYKNIRDIFFLSLCIGLASSIHLQGAAIGLLLITTLFFSGVPRILVLLAVFAGLLLPWLPVFFIDIQNNFFNSKNMLQYYLKDQYNISLDVLGRRWLTYGGVFWPRMWGFVIGGNSLAGYVIPVILLCMTVYALVKRNFNREWIVLGISFALMIVLLRYTRTPLFESYIVFLHPFILLFSGLVIYFLFIRNRFLGVLLMLLLITGSLARSVFEINHSQNYTSDFAQKWSKILIKKFPNKEIVLYDYKYDTKGQSFPIALYLDTYGHKGTEQVYIGMTATSSAKGKYGVIHREDKLRMVHFLDIDSRQLHKNEWIPVTPEYVYRDTQAWFLYKK